MEDDDMDVETSDSEYNRIPSCIKKRHIPSSRYKKDIKIVRSSSISSTSMWYLTIESVGTALKFFAPAAVLTWFYGNDSFFFRILQHCDRAIRSVLYPNPDETQHILKWLQEIFPGDKRIKSLDTIWKDGSVICDIVESVIPGSCSGHVTEDQVDLSHGQRLAEQYLGITPVFSKEDLSQSVLSTHNECKLSHFLNSIREALNQLSPPISRTGSPILNVNAYTLDYVARGMGLVTASENRKATFYIYPTAQQGMEPADISVQVKGPNCCYGSILVPAIYGRAHILRNVMMNLGYRHNAAIHLPLEYTKNQPIYERNYFLPKIVNDIDVSIVVRSDRVKVTYIPSSTGYHELSLISKGCHLVGSPFKINVDDNTSSSENKSFDEEETPIEEIKKIHKKVIFKIVDFVTEKMLLTEDGKLEKISEENAKDLLHKVESMEKMAILNQSDTSDTSDLADYNSQKRFHKSVKKMLLVLSACKEFERLASQYKYRNGAKTPDIVNSTIKELYTDENTHTARDLRKIYRDKPTSFNHTNEEDTELSNLLGENCKNTAFSQTTPISILVSSFEDDEETMVVNENVIVPFVRPKSPVFKILCKDEDLNINDDNDAKDCLLIDSPDGRCTPAIDFHIGEPVTPTTSMSFINIDVEDMDSIIHASNLEEALNKFDAKLQKNLKDVERCQSEESNSSIFTTPLRQTPYEQMTDNEIIQMYEEPLDNEDVLNFNKQTDKEYGDTDSETRRTNSSFLNSTDALDSAYISSDEANSSSEANTNSPKSSCSGKSKLFSIEEAENECLNIKEKMCEEDYAKMGPAERELWKSMTESEINKENNFNSHYKAKENSEHYPRIIKNKNASVSPIDENNAKNTNERTNLKTCNGHTLETDVSKKINIKNVKNYESADNKNNEKKSLSRMVSEKKEYWDDKIQTIEANEKKRTRTLRKRASQLTKHDSMSKKKSQNKPVIISRRSEDIENIRESSDEKLVDKWKKYWDEKIENSSPESDAKYIRKQLTKTRKFLASPDEVKSANEKRAKEDGLGSFLGGFESDSDSSASSCSESVNNRKHEMNEPMKSSILSSLSERIDHYLNNLTSPPPNIVYGESTTFSTPEQSLDIPCKEIKSVLTIERNDDRLSVVWNSDYNERRMQNLLDLRETPSPYIQDDPPNHIEQKINTDTPKKNTADLQMCPERVKTKVESLNTAAKVKQSFFLCKSKTIDLPRNESFAKLQKYFSTECLKTFAEDQRPIPNRNDFVIHNTNTTLKNQRKENCESTDSLPSLAEKKARIEMHLKSIQNRMKSQPDNSLPKLYESDRGGCAKNLRNRDDTVYAENKGIDIQTEIKMISKPIRSIVAEFENQCKGTGNNFDCNNSKKTLVKSVLQDAVSLGGTKTNSVKNAPTVSPVRNENSSFTNLRKKCVSMPSNLNSTEKAEDEADEFIQSENYKERFRQTKSFFQKLDCKQRNAKQTNIKPLNECEQLLYESSSKSKDLDPVDLTKLNEEIPKENKDICCEKKVVRPNRKIRHKAMSAPVSDTEYEYQKQLHEQSKLFKISEKFLIDDFFKDIAGDYNETGFRGIPNKSAVLAAFRSIESVDQTSSYEFTKPLEENNNLHTENRAIDPKKFKEKFDYSTSGLILRKDFIKLQRARRNSAPVISLVSSELYNSI